MQKQRSYLKNWFISPAVTACLPNLDKTIWRSIVTLGQKWWFLSPTGKADAMAIFLDILPWSESLGFAFMLQHWQRMVASSCMGCNRLAQLTCMYWKARRPVESGHQVGADLASWWCKDVWYLNQSFVIFSLFSYGFLLMDILHQLMWKNPFLLRLHIFFLTSAEFFHQPYWPWYNWALSLLNLETRRPFSGNGMWTHAGEHSASMHHLRRSGEGSELHQDRGDGLQE